MMSRVLVPGSNFPCVLTGFIDRLPKLRKVAVANWQAAHPFSRRCKNRIGKRGSNRRHARLANTGGAVGAGNDVYFDLWGFENTQHLVVVEITLLDLSVLQGNFRFQR